ncbi:MAG: hypothetical protein IT460_07700 [Planctomycetes bacterium]|nr:hypothetical protein [Planctomycetota bacterium]
MTRRDGPRPPAARVALALLAVLAPLATSWLAGAAGTLPSSGPSIEESTLALGGLQRLLLGAGPRAEPATPVTARPPSLPCNGWSDAGVPPGNEPETDQSAPRAAAECRRL